MLGMNLTNARVVDHVVQAPSTLTACFKDEQLKGEQDCGKSIIKNCESLCDGSTFVKGEKAQ
ncbi:hypothetical protein PG990_000087 [Apiospora arundinis]